MAIDNDTNDEVGYCRPPKHAQFKKGESGNPKGRPKGTKNTSTILENALNAKVVVTESGRQKTMTASEIALKALMNKAMGGDLKAIQEVLRLREKHIDVEPPSNPAPQCHVHFYLPDNGRDPDIIKPTMTESEYRQIVDGDKDTEGEE